MAWTRHSTASSAATASVNHPIEAGSNRLVVAGWASESGSGAQPISSATYNGNAMTQACVQAVSNVAQGCDLWYRDEATGLPGAGTYSCAGSGGSSPGIIVGSWSGVATGIQSSDPDNSTGGTTTCQFGTTSAGGLGVSMTAVNDAVAVSHGGGEAELAERQDFSGGAGGAMSEKSLAAGTDTMTATASTSRMAKTGAAWAAAATAPVYAQSSYRFYNDDGSGLGDVA